jgi:uncharacterized protein involved in exopolysaccharide biosynthesis/Mrp family chromosome partitioning ATPase
MDRLASSWDGREPKPGELHFQQLVKILCRRCGIVIAIATIGTGLALAGGLMIPPQYTAKAEIVSETRAVDTGDGRTAISEADAQAALETHIAALTSRAHLTRALDNLLQDPDFLAAASRAPRGDQSIAEALWLDFGAQLRHWASRLIGAADLQDQASNASALPLDKFERRLNVYQERGSHVIAVAFSSTGPVQAALAANRVAQLYVEVEDERKRARTSYVLSWFDQRIPEAKAEFERADTAVQKYRVAHGLSEPGRTDLSDQKLADLTRQLTAAESDLAKRQAKLAAFRDLQRQGSGIDALVENLDLPARTELLRREVALLQSQGEAAAATFGEKHPKVQQLAAELEKVRLKLSNEVSRAVDGLQNEVRVAGEQVRSIRERLATLQAVSSQAQQGEARLRELEREAATAGQVYEGLLQRREQLRVQQQTTVPDLRLLSLASPPERPSSTNPLLFVLPSLIIFSIGGGFLAVAAEQLDRSMRSAEDVYEALGVPCIGFVPSIHRGGKARPHEYLLENPSAAYAEAIRSVIAALQLAAAGRAPRVVLVTSSVPKEGKTTLAVSLAVYAALIGRRALLVDLDFGHAAVSRELGLRAETGVADAFLFDNRTALAVQRVPGLDLDCLPVRASPDDPLRAFLGGHLPRLFHQLRDNYDCVVIDSPPLLAVAGARLFAAIADKILLTVKWGSTRRDVEWDALNLLRDPGILGENYRKLVCAVLTQVDLKKYAQYRYGSRKSLPAIRGLVPRTTKPVATATNVGDPHTPSLKGATTTLGEPALSADTAAEQRSAAMLHRRRFAWRLAIGLLLCVGIGGSFAIAGDDLSLFVHRMGQGFTGFGKLDFSTRSAQQKPLPAIAWTTLPKEAVAPPSAGKEETVSQPAAVPEITIAEPRTDKTNVPASSPTAKATPLPTAEAAQTPLPYNVPDATPATAPEAALANSNSTPSPTAAALSGAVSAPTSPAPKPTAGQAETRLSAAEIGILVARGDALLSRRDITSARLFYQRAIEAGDGRAALRMGTTYDPAFLDQAFRGVSGDQQEAAFWYRRAAELGEAKAHPPGVGE